MAMCNIFRLVRSPRKNKVDQMQKDELDQVLQRLQLENLELKRELERRKTATTSTPDLDRVSSPGRRSEGRGATLPRLSGHNHQGRSVPSLKSAQSQSDVMDEARALRLHKQRLEHRSRILEQQNEQLELQLQRLKKVIEQQRAAWEDDDGATDAVGSRPTRMQSLLATVDDLGRAMENLVVSVVYDSDQEQ
ncbi:unnamed protein product [Nippostrongylus brasiliensis]|uniref:DTNB n=1 Tax=Nippostrongylus brasiliensis TaxID=27835 RepID=A0A0N4YSU2_NIPBR|nr:unnamed protein product [Nippostrongylus brasiliensis]